MALVRQSPDGAIYETKRPVLPDGNPPLVGAPGSRYMQRGLSGKRGGRLDEIMETTRVLLSSPEAERYTLFDDYWGTLPAWCRKCRSERWVKLDLLRRGGPDIFF